MSQKSNNQYIMLNVCLIPDEATEIGRLFNSNAIQTSARLNALANTMYELHSAPPAPAYGDENIFSLPHCTVLHIKVPAESESVVIKALSGIIGRSFNAKVQSLEYVSANAFVRDAILGKVNTAASVSSKIWWYKVDRDAPLIALQQEILAELKQVLPNQDFAITSANENYRPHFTLSAQPDTEAHIPESEHQRLLAEPALHATIPCRVALGGVGTIGQVPYIIAPESLAL